MRYTIPALTALGLAAAALASSGAARAYETPRTVSDYATTMNVLAGQLDIQVSDRQKAGDMAAAQRLVLVAAMVRRSAEEFRDAEQEDTSRDVSGLPAPLPQLAEAAFAKATDADKSAADHAAFADEAHVTFNALLAALPQRKRHPVLFGMLSADLAEADAPLDHDIVVYGYQLADPVYKLPPVVTYGRTELPASAIALQDDRIGVTLPDAVKTAARFAPSPCQSRPSFGLRIRSVYGQEVGRWPIVWHTQVVTNIDFYALPTPVIYSAAITANAETTSVKTATLDFRQRGSLTVADCERTAKAEVLLPLPDDARDAACSAAWVNTTSATQMTSHCNVEDGKVHAVGEISGGSKICSPQKLCTCASQAQGWLEARGAYNVVESTSQLQANADFPPLTFPAGGVAHGRIALDEAQKLRHVSLALTRRACPTPVDTVDLQIGDNPDAKSTGVSKTGAFRASIEGGALTVGTADAIAASGERTP